MRTKGINYDTGFFPGRKASRPELDPAQVRREMEVIASDLHCNAVRVSGGDPDRLEMAARAAADAGLTVWWSPLPAELTLADTSALMERSAEQAERLRRGGTEVVLVTGCELSVFAKGFLPGEDSYERLAALASPDPQLWAALAGVPAELTRFLADVVGSARRHFGGPVTYASAPWEHDLLDWTAFDVVSVDAYRNAQNAAAYRDDLEALVAKAGKPVVVTEFGCCTYAGAADRGAIGWAVVDDVATPPYVVEELVRDEPGQAAYLREVLATLEAAGVDGAFWFTFAGYERPHRQDPRYDLDLASFGVVKLLDGGRGRAYPDLPWEPKASFRALAAAYTAAG